MTTGSQGVIPKVRWAGYVMRRRPGIAGLVSSMMILMRHASAIEGVAHLENDAA
jgi:hypothetical protein